MAANENNPRKGGGWGHWLIIITIVIATLAGSALAIKATRGGYNALDLAIYNQVLWHTSQGELFNFTIHPHSYLGDHLELILLAVVPFYWLLAQPVTLVIVQTIALMAAVWPLWLIARQWLNPRWSFVISLVWLFSPFVHNINSFEFHALAFAPFFLFWTVYFYLTKRWWAFLGFALVSLTIREDISLIILTFGVLAWLEKRSWRWRLVPFVGGLIWFVVALKISPLITGYEQYKFFAYYGWLGTSPLEMISTLVNHPLYVAQNIFTASNVLFLLGLFVPFLFLPLLRPRYLILLGLPLLQLIFLRNPSELSLLIHYTAPVLPALFVAGIESVHWLQTRARAAPLRFLASEPGLAQTVLLTAAVGGLVLMGPPIGFAKQILATNHDQNAQLRQDVTSFVPTGWSVAAGYYLLTGLSGREKVYSLHYQFLGKRQFSDIDYRIPDDTDYTLVNAADALIYHVTYEETYEKNLTGDDRLREFLDSAKRGCQLMVDTFLLYQRGEPDQCQPFIERVTIPKNMTARALNEKFSFLGWQSNGEYSLRLEELSIAGHAYQTLPLTTYWRADQKLDRDYSIKLLIKRGDEIMYEKRYPFSYGLFVPTSWQPGVPMAMTYRFLVPDSLGATESLSASLQVELLDGRLWLDGWRGIEPEYDKITPIGEPIVIGTL